MTTKYSYILFNNIVLIAFLLWFVYQNVNSVDCITNQSVIALVDNEITFAQCHPPLTLVSCGFKTQLVTTRYFKGSYINGSICFAQNHQNYGGVYAVARCCDLSAYSVSCITYKSELSLTVDDDRTSVDCQPSETIMGCTGSAKGSFNHFDGGFPGDGSTISTSVSSTKIYNPVANTCWAQNAGWASETNEGAYAYSTCCKSSDSKVQFDCLSTWRASVPINATQNITATCPFPGYFMTSCSANSPFTNMNQWTIENNSCVSRSARSGAYGRVIGICCRVITESPTMFPSTDPSTAPTMNPSINPTMNPTSNPTPSTINPTIVPTKSPTIYPSTYPTSDPTFQPTDVPVTIAPSNVPTTSPTTKPPILNVLNTTTTSGRNAEVPQTTKHYQFEKTGYNESGDRGMYDLDNSILVIFGVIGVIVVLCVLILMILLVVILKKKYRSNISKSVSTLSASDDIQTSTLGQQTSDAHTEMGVFSNNNNKIDNEYGINVMTESDSHDNDLLYTTIDTKGDTDVYTVKHSDDSDDIENMYTETKSDANVTLGEGNDTLR